MAKQTSLFPFTGKLGNVIGYERNGEYFLRSMPETVRQTAATRHAARRFGIASRKAALIRNAFNSELDIRCDSSHINRLNKVLIAAKGNSALTGFRFNQHAGTDRFFTVMPTLSGNGILHFPAQELSKCKDITALEVKVIAIRIDFMARQVTSTDTVLLMVDAREPFAGTSIPLDVPGTGTLVITLQVRGLQNNIPSCNRQLVAADIIAVVEPLTGRPFKKRTYPQRAHLQPKDLLSITYVHACGPVIQRE